MPKDPQANQRRWDRFSQYQQQRTRNLATLGAALLRLGWQKGLRNGKTWYFLPTPVQVADVHDHKTGAVIDKVQMTYTGWVNPEAYDDEESNMLWGEEAHIYEKGTRQNIREFIRPCYTINRAGLPTEGDAAMFALASQLTLYMMDSDAMTRIKDQRRIWR